MRRFLRRLRGAFGNALVWAASWFSVSSVLGSALYVLGGLPSLGFLAMVVWPALMTGFTGFVVGAAFSVFVGAAYRHREVGEIRVAGFAMGGAAISAVLLPVFTFAPVVLSGLGLPPAWLVAALGGWGAAFGGVTAGASILLAKKGERRLVEGPLAEFEREQAKAVDLLRVETP